MEVSNSDEMPKEFEPVESEASNSAVMDEDEVGATADDGDSSVVVYIFGKTLDFPMTENSEHAGDFYVYKNVFTLLPKSISSNRSHKRRLRTLKFFGNEINLFSPPTAAEKEEFGSLVGLECLQVKIPSLEFGGLPLNKLKALKELELSKAPPRRSAFQILSEIEGLKNLTKLSVSHMAIRYLPPGIGCLDKLEYLDLSFNKMTCLPEEISNLNALITLNAANNKLAKLPKCLSSLQTLEMLDLSNNRLTSLWSFNLDLMHKLQNLNLQYNKIADLCGIQIPSWVCCNLEGNGKDALDDDCTSSSGDVEDLEDVHESAIQIQKNNGSVSGRRRGVCRTSSSLITGECSNSSAVWRYSRLRKQECNLHQRASKERLINYRKWKPASNKDAASESSPEGESEVINLDDLGDKDEDLISGEVQSEKNKDESSAPSQKGSSSAISTTTTQPKRKKSDGDPENDDIVAKYAKTVPDSSSISRKYSDFSLCSTEDYLPDGFYDAGCGRPFMPLEVYEQNFHLDSREVLLVNNISDAELAAIKDSAQDLVDSLNTKEDENLGSKKEEDENQLDELQVASLLAIFVSDHFGGSDRVARVECTRKANPFSDYTMPFVCTCPTRNRGSIDLSTKPVEKTVDDIGLTHMCENSLRSIKARRNSNVVPIGTLGFGVCRHRALLLKYLCDRVKPRVRCELVRGYLDFMPHAWNVILIKKDGKEKRMVVDACRPIGSSPASYWI